MDKNTRNVKNNKKIRETGYYWVNLKAMHDYWMIAQWIGSVWVITAETATYSDDDFEEIDERKIERK